MYELCKVVEFADLVTPGVSQSGNALTSLIHGAAKGRSVSQLMNELHCAVPSSTQIGTSPFYIGSQDDCDLRIKDPFITSVCIRLDYEGKRGAVLFLMKSKSKFCCAQSLNSLLLRWCLDVSKMDMPWKSANDK